MKYFNHFALAFCSLGVLWQTLTIVSRYARYPITIDTVLARLNNVNLPAISVCVDYKAVVAKVKEYYPEIYRKKASVTSNDSSIVWSRYLTVEEYLTSSISRNEAIRECTIYSYNMAHINCSDWLAGDNDHISWKWKCFTLFEKQEQQMYITNKSRSFRTEDLVGVPWFSIDVSTEDHALSLASTILGVSIHPEDLHVAINEGSRSFRRFDFSLHRQVALAYTRQVIRHLGAPYPSNCVQYTDHGEKLRKSKVADRCSQKTFYNRTGLFPLDILASNMTIYGKTRFATELKGHTKAIQERYECNRIFPNPRCEILDYHMNVKGFAKLKPTEKKDTFSIVTYGPTDVTTYISEQPAFDLLDLLSYSGSFLSMWLGLSLSDIVRSLMKRVERRSTSRKAFHHRDSDKYTKTRHFRIITSKEQPFCRIKLQDCF
ncbi:hypothetical protein HDE_12191 [Halotydeus destructor]|nr:hypothetical protein HDE_12191 [Halotydeus destructor]